MRKLTVLIFIRKFLLPTETLDVAVSSATEHRCNTTQSNKAKLPALLPQKTNSQMIWTTKVFSAFMASLKFACNALQLCTESCIQQFKATANVGLLNKA